MPCRGQLCRHKQPTTIDERLAIATEFLEVTGINMPMIVDSMQNSFLERFAAWPERFYVFQWSNQSVSNGPMVPMSPSYRLRFVNVPSATDGHNLDHLRNYLDQLFEQTQEPARRELSRSNSAEAIKARVDNEHVKAVFSKHSSESATVTKAGLADMLAELGWSEDLVQTTFDTADSNQDGVLSLDEFSLMYQSFSEQAKKQLNSMATLSHVAGAPCGGEPCNPHDTLATA